MTAPICSIAADVLDEIDNTTWSLACTARVDYAVSWDRHEITSAPELIITPGEVTQEPDTESSDRQEYRIDIGILAEAADKMATEALISFCDEVQRHFSRYRSTTFRADVMRSEWSPIYNPEELRENQLFVASIKLVFVADRV